MRRGAWLVCLFCLGCHTLAGPEARAKPRGSETPVPAPPAPGPGPSAETLWHEGQAAMRAGNAGLAIVRYQASLARNPALFQNHLSLAAAFLEQGDHLHSCEHLARFVEVQPEHRNARYLYAELLF